MIKPLTSTIAAYTETCHAFNEEGIRVGSLVINPGDFLGFVEFGLRGLEFNDKGQGFLILPDSAWEHVVCGDGPQRESLGDYIPAEHRGLKGLYLKRQFAGRTAFCAAVIYTPDGFREDPEVDNNAVIPDGVEHIIVAVIASCAGSALPAETLVNNMSGSNATFILTGDDAHDAGKAREWVKMAKASGEQWGPKGFSIVAG